jgi:hypothetical protein
LADFLIQCHCIRDALRVIKEIVVQKKKVAVRRASLGECPPRLRVGLLSVAKNNGSLSASFAG